MAHVAAVRSISLSNISPGRNTIMANMWKCFLMLILETGAGTAYLFVLMCTLGISDSELIYILFIMLECCDCLCGSEVDLSGVTLTVGVDCCECLSLWAFIMTINVATEQHTPQYINRYN